MVEHDNDSGWSSRSLSLGLKVWDGENGADNLKNATWIIN